MNVAERSRTTTRETNYDGQQMCRELDRALTRAFRFSGRERQILRQLIAGESVELIARRLELRVSSIHKHMHRIFAKTRTEERQGLIKLGFRLAAHRRIAGNLAFA